MLQSLEQRRSGRSLDRTVEVVAMLLNVRTATESTYT